MCRTEDKFTDSRRVLASLTAGGMAGVLSWIPALPFDVVKSLYQVETSKVETALHSCLTPTRALLLHVGYFYARLLRLGVQKPPHTFLARDSI